MNTAWVMGFIVGLALVAVGCMVVRKLVLKGRKPAEYDERQQIARGRAFTAAYITLLFYLVFWMLMRTLEVPFFDRTMSVMAGALLSLAVFVGHCIFHDAYFRASESPKTWLAILGGITLLNLGIGVWHLASGATPEERLWENANLAVGLMFTAVLVCLLVKRAMDARNGED